jgi:hypothetical protein
MDLFKRRPRFRSVSRQHPLVENTSAYPSLAADFQILEDHLLQSYHKYDHDAIRLQNAYWWTYVVLIVGGACATILGILQLAFMLEGFGIAGAVVAAFLGCTTLALNAFRYQERYMNSRLVAEELRSEYFLFLGRLAHYQGNSNCLETLKHRVRTITAKMED